MNRSKLLTLGLLSVFILSACTPSTTAPPPTPTLAPEPAAPESMPSEEPPTAPVAEAPLATEAAPAEEPVVFPTSRGNELEATDPTTVNIASGQPQLIEFFAFW